MDAFDAQKQFTISEIVGRMVAPSADIDPIPWVGNDADFADFIHALYSSGRIKADSVIAAYRIAAPHFCGVNTNPKVLDRQYRQRKRHKFDPDNLIESILASSPGISRKRKEK